MNFLLAIVIFSCFTFFEGYTKIVEAPIISEVHEYIPTDTKDLESPAMKAGLQKDDKIIYIDNAKINSFSDIQNIIYQNCFLNLLEFYYELVFL